MFVTAKVEEEEGSIAQIIVVSFVSESLKEYLQLISKISSSIIGWLYEMEVIERGYLCDTDFPQWLKNDAIVKNIMIRRSYLLFEYHKKIREGCNYVPMELVRIYKHYQQVRYNIAKAGLDKNTENG